MHLSRTSWWQTFRFLLTAPPVSVGNSIRFPAPPDLTSVLSQPLWHICQSGWIKCSAGGKLPDSCSCPFPFRECFFVRSQRRGAIFGACCAGCFWLAHPFGLVFKPWPSGSGMMRTLFQSPSPLKARQSSAGLDTGSAVHQQCRFPPAAQIKVWFFIPPKPRAALPPRLGTNLYLEMKWEYYSRCSMNATKNTIKI